MKRIFLGDVNFDGKITRLDADLVSGHITGIKLLTGDALTAADINKDGSVTEDDYTAIDNHVNGKAIITGIVYKEDDTSE